MNIARYRKFLVALAGALAVILTAGDVVETADWVEAVLAVLTALGVYVVPNQP